MVPLPPAPVPGPGPGRGGVPEPGKASIDLSRFFVAPQPIDFRSQPVFTMAGGGSTVAPMQVQPTAPNINLNVHNNISTIDARGVAEFVNSDSFLHSLSGAVQINRAFIATNISRGLVGIR
jgi:hypothetical protein